MGALDMFQVVKRDGEVDEFKIGKITAAIHKAFDAKEKNYSEEMIDLLGLRVTSDFQKKITDNKITGQCGECADPGRICRCGKSLHSLPQAEGKGSQHEVNDPGLQRNRKQLCEG